MCALAVCKATLLAIGSGILNPILIMHDAYSVLWRTIREVIRQTSISYAENAKVLLIVYYAELVLSRNRAG
jgi:hypothetical protein